MSELAELKGQANRVIKYSGNADSIRKALNRIKSIEKYKLDAQKSRKENASSIKKKNKNSPIENRLSKLSKKVILDNKIFRGQRLKVILADKKPAPYINRYFSDELNEGDPFQSDRGLFWA